VCRIIRHIRFIDTAIKLRAQQVSNGGSLEGDALKVAVKRIGTDMVEQVIVHCYEVNEDVKSIVRFVKSAGATLAGYIMNA
jgi:hypothetical protein